MQPTQIVISSSAPVAAPSFTTTVSIVVYLISAADLLSLILQLATRICTTPTGLFKSDFESDSSESLTAS